MSMPLSSKNLHLLPIPLIRNLHITLLTKPMYLLPPSSTMRERPPDDVHEGLHALAATLNASLSLLVAAGALDGLRMVLKTTKGNVGA